MMKFGYDLGMLRIVVFSIVLGLSSAASAQDAEVGETPSDRATSFRAVTGAEQESVPGGMLLVGAYGLVFALTLAFVVRLARFARGTDERIARLEAEISRSSEDA